MCVAQGVSPGATRRSSSPLRVPPPLAVAHGGGRFGGTNDPRANALGYTHAAPLGLLRPFIKVVK